MFGICMGPDPPQVGCPVDIRLRVALFLQLHSLHLHAIPFPRFRHLFSLVLFRMFQCVKFNQILPLLC